MIRALILSCCLAISSQLPVIYAQETTQTDARDAQIQELRAKVLELEGLVESLSREQVRQRETIDPFQRLTISVHELLNGPDSQGVHLTEIERKVLIDGVRQAVMRNVASETWEPYGGEGTIEFTSASQSLEIRNHRSLHAPAKQTIEDLADAVSKLRKLGIAPALTPRNVIVNADELQK